MDYAPIIYCRTRNSSADYRPFILPEDSFCPESTIDDFVQFIRQVINVDNPIFGGIENFRWSFYRVGNFIIWGAGFKNELLGLDFQDFFYDFSNRSIRSFIGIVIKVKNIKDLSLPYDEALLKTLFKKYIIPRWNEKVSNCEYKSFMSVKNFPEPIITANHYPTIEALNTNTSITKVFPPDTQEIAQLFAKALETPVTKLNLVSGLNRVFHAVDMKFMNSTCFDAKKTETFNLVESKENDEKIKNFRSKKRRPDNFPISPEIEKEKEKKSWSLLGKRNKNIQETEDLDEKGKPATKKISLTDFLSSRMQADIDSEEDKSTHEGVDQEEPRQSDAKTYNKFSSLSSGDHTGVNSDSDAEVLKERVIQNLESLTNLIANNSFSKNELDNINQFLKRYMNEGKE